MVGCDKWSSYCTSGNHIATSVCCDSSDTLLCTYINIINIEARVSNVVMLAVVHLY